MEQSFSAKSNGRKRPVESGRSTNGQPGQPGAGAASRGCHTGALDLCELMKLNQAEHKVLHVGRGNPKDKCKVGGGWSDSSPEEKDLGVLADEKLNMIWQWALAARNQPCPGCTRSEAGRSREVILSPALGSAR